MTYEQLIENEMFIGFCEKWKADRWCPIPLVDWLIESDMPELAEAARWAVNTEVRKNANVWNLNPNPRVYPYQSFLGSGFRFIPMLDFKDKGSSEVPMRNYPQYRKAFHKAIADYLFAFDPDIAAEYPPKKPIV